MFKSTILDTLQKDVDALKAHRHECDLMHEQHKEHKRRSDDAMNNLTDSNMMLAKSITDMNATVTRVVSIIDRDAPDIKLINNARAWFGVNRFIFWLIVGIASGITAIITATRFFL